VTGASVERDELPRFLVLTDREASERAGRALETTVAAALDAGAPVIVLREKDLAAAERRQVGERLAALVARARSKLVVASDPWLAAELDAWGIHLAAADSLPDRPDRARDLAIGRSCHGVAELRAAAEQGLDWVTLSPVHLTTSKPGYGPALGVDGLARLANERGCPPVFALGGIDAQRVLACLAAGAHGVAVMGAVMGAIDPAAAAAELLAAVDAASSDHPAPISEAREP
jgi:thiamine-phosphate pyrophosphorylase